MLDFSTRMQWLLVVAVAAAVRGEPEYERYAADISQQQLPLVVSDNGTDGNGCHFVCESLAGSPGDDLQVYQHGAIPDSFTTSFYAVQQRELVPLCVAEPRTAAGVSAVVQAVTKHRCPFAIKSGGHSNAPGTNAQQGGLVIDLRSLDQVDISDDNATVAIGPGNLWGSVYQQLEPRGLVVAGGRVDSVGVGGFTLGGGISFLSRQYGWAVDNVVLPNGTVTNANPENNPDLYFALRGGGSSFGIVTRFDFEALALNKTFWGGSDVNVLAGMGATRKRLAIQDRREWSFRSAVFALIRLLHRGLDLFGYGTTLDKLASGFASLAHEQQMDAAAAAYLFFSYLPDLRTYVAGSTYVYSQNTEEPAALQPLTGVPHLYTTRRLRTLSDLTLEVTEMNPMDQRQHWRTTTFKADPALIAQFGEIFLQESAPMRYAVPDALQSTNVQLLTKHEIALSQRNGDNAFGLKPEDGPFVFLVTTTAYKHAKDDEVVRVASERIHERIKALGKEMGLYHPFIYPNYAAVGQDVFAGFAPENLARLLEIQSRYDPGRVFANLQPGHLTLNDNRLKK
ncbi:FAD binding domain-containing protein [Akanthomyces lecanii RCEF 1005]|uniref:FAD binding domain-containing protein n=1 Tax=Akanthomyces lecanii RCEF 1005 TaxID=1081108 RepID=A0A162IQX5_CORDF|nr:FAD binding domain-containing protein [Akanthomyces lecanii RCEF 1005]